MRRSFVPLFGFLGAAALGYYLTLVATPYALMRAAAAKAVQGRSTNHFYFPPMITAANQSIVRSSPDLSYSLCVFDVSKGPVLIGVEPVPGHYWSISIFDARTDVAAVRSDRDTGGKPALLALLKRGQVAPPGFEAVLVNYDGGIALLRVLLADKAEFAATDILRRKSFCRAA